MTFLLTNTKKSENWSIPFYCLIVTKTTLEAEVAVAAKPVRNQFNYGERSAQTLNQKQRHIAIQTQPPPRENLSITVNQ